MNVWPFSTRLLPSIIYNLTLLIHLGPNPVTLQVNHLLKHSHHNITLISSPELPQTKLHGRNGVPKPLPVVPKVSQYSHTHTLNWEDLHTQGSGLTSLQPWCEHMIWLPMVTAVAIVVISNQRSLL